MPREKMIPAPAGYPWFGWTFDTVKAHFTANPPAVGDKVLLYNAHGGMHRYFVVHVEAASVGKQRRIVVSRAGWSGGRSFYPSGKNYDTPKGQTVLLPLIDEIIEQMDGAEDVVLDAPLYSGGAR